MVCACGGHAPHATAHHAPYPWLKYPSPSPVPRPPTVWPKAKYVTQRLLSTPNPPLGGPKRPVWLACLPSHFPARAVQPMHHQPPPHDCDALSLCIPAWGRGERPGCDSKVVLERYPVPHAPLLPWPFAQSL
eukprot:2124095-Amphidinium_carterae.1